MTDGSRTETNAWSTYRVQLHRGFTFADLAGIADYLAALGVTHAYCSPSLQAVAGSTHGYDVVDPHRMNSDLGGIEGYAALSEALRSHGLGAVLDIVPNHMALDGRANRWWWDVLANGPSSPYARYFDIDWDSQRKLTGIVLVPILGDQYGRVLEAGDIGVERDGGSFVVRYRDHLLPVSPRSVDTLLAQAAALAGSEELATLATELGELPHALVTEPDLMLQRQRESRILDRVRRLVDRNPEVGDAIEAQLKVLNHDPDQLDALLERQNYRLAFWRTASEDLDYRRFFNIETLAGVRVEDEGVFADTHGLIESLVSGGMVDGLRVDHVDGLRDPEGYLVRLAAATDGTWVVVEKILAPDEGGSMPRSWPTAGTTGYEFLNRVNGLFVAGDNMAQLTDDYHAFIGEVVDYPELVHASKMQIMREELAAEVDRLTGLLALVCERHRRYRDYTRRELRDGLREVLAGFPVYRTYVRPGDPVRDQDRAVIAQATREASSRRPDLDPQQFEFLGALLRLEFPGEREEELVARFQQLSSPVMAKGVEDTVFYRYNRLVSLNEVGGSPDVVEGAVARFHDGCRQTAERWPRALLTLATHDTKRGPDIRARINVLSEIPGPWREAVERWTAHNDRHRLPAGPDRNAEYLLYQTLVGAWPWDTGRVQAYMEKASKEAKVHTAWSSPNAAYDEAMRSFVAAVAGDGWFATDLAQFLARQRIVEAGRINSLAQTALLLSAPGCAVYQGTELWDHSLVDPDNRRPVDYALRRALLAGTVAGWAGAATGGAAGGVVGAAGGGVAGAAAPPPIDDSGAAKLWLTQRLLGDRRRRPVAYRGAGYAPLAAAGEKADHVVAFTRGGVVTVVPRLSLGVDLARSWGDTTVSVPPGRWADVLTGGPVEGGEVAVGDLLARFPVAVLAAT